MPAENIHLAKVLKSATDLVSVGNRKITLTTILKYFERGSENPSLEDIANLLTKWNYDNAALKLEPENLSEIPVPLIAHIKEGEGRFVLVKKLNVASVVYFDGNRTHNQDLNFFLDRWRGIVLLLESNQHSGEPGYARKRVHELLLTARTPLLIFLFAIALLLALDFTRPNPFILLFNALHLLLSLTGLYLSCTLLWMDTAGKNGSRGRFCKLGKHFDCDSSPQSRSRALGGILPWSQVGLLYFLTQATLTIICSLTGAFAQIGPVVAWVDLAASLFLFYFLYEQLNYPGKWCLLCTLVQVVLVLTVALYLLAPTYQLPQHIPWKILLLSVSFSVSTVLTAVPFLRKYAAATGSQKVLKRFFSDTSLFKQKLNRQHVIAQLPDGLSGFQFGPHDSTNVITFITNPYCAPCSQAHKELEELMAELPDLQVKIVAITASDHQKRPRRIVSHWIAMQEQNMDIQLALSAWYKAESKSYDSFVKKYPATINDNHLAQADQYADWAERSGLTSTPAFYFNGRSLPEPYRIQDLKYLISSL